MKSHREIIEAFEGEFAKVIGVSAEHARVMKSRDSIPSYHWLAVVRAASRLGIKGITLDLLAHLEAKKFKKMEMN